uniref:ENT domain-containing protein n=1 Tax=Glossina brevipalpis TaxID=37001 RepID=A0A1A9WKL5_9MUSC
MWPQALQMTRDECRGILRRLELESYSQVISVFRAQGGLSDAKAKLLEELRAIFHISQERHRAEARRVANDEQLATIAESISGPNTWQEWSREGRRPYPMLPRVAPKTALVLIANNIAEETISENAKVPYPSETAEAVKEEQRELLNETFERSNFVVSSDPFKVPEIPAAHKRNLKRNINEQNTVIGSKKRAVSNNSQKNLVGSHYNKHHHVTANSVQGNSTQFSLSKKASSTQNHKNLQQQRYFHQQQQIQKQKIAKKISKNSANPVNVKRQVTPAKSGRRVQKTMEQQQQLLIKKQEKQLEIQTHMDLTSAMQQEPSSTPLDIQKFVGYSPQSQLPQQIFMDNKECIDSTPVLIAASLTPQTAVSKRDITTNINKLQMQQHSGSSTTNSLHQTVTGMNSTSPTGKLEKSLITPVQKYIVEDRQMPLGVNNVPPSSASLVNLTGIQAQNASSGHLIQVSSAGVSPKVVTMPQFSVAATKLRAANTIIASGTKLSSTTGKKISPVLSSVGNPQINTAALHELANVATSQTQVFNLIDASPNSNLSPNQTVVPLHTPPAIIQIQNTSNNNAGEHLMSSQGKVLTANILPIVLSCNTSTNNVNTIAASSSLSTSVNTTTSTNTTSEGGLVKSFPSGVILSTSSSNVVPVSLSNSNSVISTLSAGATVFRKPPGIIKTSMANTTLTKSSAAHIISNVNVKLTPVSVNTSTVSPLTSTSSPFKSVMSSTTGMVRASVKICQSPNGKVFIQPAGLVDGSKVALNTNSLQHKVISAGISHSSSTPISNATSGQRIAIQKVQIIPASLGSPATSNNNLSPKPGTLSLTSGTGSPTGKGNMIIMPVSTKATVRPVTIAKSNNNLTIKNSNHKQLINSSHSTAESVNTVNANILVLGNTTSLKEKISPVVQSKFDNNQLLNEDAPLDILNMPIVMDSGIGSNETVTVLGTGVVNRSVNAPIIVDHSLHPRNVLLNATDWEMELDHAITTAANNNNNNNNILKDQKAFSSSKSKSTISTSSCPTITTPILSGHKQPYPCLEYSNDEISKNKEPQLLCSNIIVDDSFDDVIVEEREEEDEESQKSLQIQDNPKILDMQIFHQQPVNLTDQNLITKSINDDKLHTSNLRSSIEDQKFNTTSVEQITSSLLSTTCTNTQQSSEIDAGFDETIVAEIDENTAIEYIEEDGTHIPVVTSCNSIVGKDEKITKLPAALSTTDMGDNAILKISATLNNSYSNPIVLQTVVKSAAATTTTTKSSSITPSANDKNSSSVQQA